VNRFLLLTVLLLTGAALASPPAAHHFSRTLAEADYNRESKKLEVALSIAPHDLEWVLTQRRGKRVDLERTPGAEDFVLEYLSEVFSIKNAAGDKVDLDWIGMEVHTKVAWLYFEVDLPDGLEKVQLTNRILLRWERDQVNTVNLTDGETRATLTFDRHETRQLLG